ncbi:hypothetical protein IPJ72_01600 [Candidatus Peregrinibacteria bacterium]|nr:MAG: hypothetical protein IPJ72_01600 [Candidatus Peregrinibacteria bacterium]
MKKSDQDTLVWAVDLLTGNPVSDLPLSLKDSAGRSVQTGVTNLNGAFYLQKKLEDTLYVEVGTPDAQDSWSMVQTFWNGGVPLFPYNRLGSWVPDETHMIYLMTDRTHYQPNDTLSFKALVRLNRDAFLSAPLSNRVIATLFDSGHDAIFQTDFTLDETGAVDGSIALPSSFAPGDYDLEVSMESTMESAHQPFTIHAADPHSFQIEFNSTQTEWTGEGPVSIPVRAFTQDGNTLSDAQMYWELTQLPIEFDAFDSLEPLAFAAETPSSCTPHSFCESGRDLVDQGEAILPHGDYAFEFNHLPTAGPYAYQLLVRVTSSFGETVERIFPFYHPPSFHVFGYEYAEFTGGTQ